METKLTDEQQSARDRLIVECMALGYLINRTTEYAVFVSLSGHIDSLGIRICRDKPTRYNEELAATDFKLDGTWEPVDFTNPNGWLESKRDMLKRIAETREIPFDDMTKVAREVYDHYF